MEHGLRRLGQEDCTSCCLRYHVRVTTKGIAQSMRTEIPPIFIQIVIGFRKVSDNRELSEHSAPCYSTSAATVPVILRTLVADGRLGKGAVSTSTVQHLYREAGLPRGHRLDIHTRLRWQAVSAV